MMKKDRRDNTPPAVRWSQDLEDLIELSMLRDEVQHLKSYAIRLERENAALMDRLSHRRPSTAVRHRDGWLRHLSGMILP